MDFVGISSRRDRHQHGLGLDVDGQVVLAEVSVQGQEVRPIRSARIFPHAIKDSSAPATEATSDFTEGLSMVVKRWRLKGRSVAISVPSQLVVMRQLTVPLNANPGFIRSMVEREVVVRLPFAANSIQWDYYLAGTTMAGEQSVVVVAAPLDTIRSWLSVVTAAGLRPSEVEPSALAGLRWAKSRVAFPTASAMLVILMHQRVVMTLVRDGVAVSMLQAELIWDERLESYADEVSQEIARSAMFFRSREPSPLERVVLIDLVGASEPVKRGVAVRTELLVEVCPAPLDGELPQFDFPDQPTEIKASDGLPALAVGLALRRASG